VECLAGVRGFELTHSRSNRVSGSGSSNLGIWQATSDLDPKPGIILIAEGFFGLFLAVASGPFFRSRKEPMLVTTQDLLDKIAQLPKRPHHLEHKIAKASK
jgi:hypothetical protein